MHYLVRRLCYTFLLFVPDDLKPKHRAIVYLHADGKAKEAKPGGEIEELVMKGYIVAAADLLGWVKPFAA